MVKKVNFIRLSDEMYEIIKVKAEADQRSINGMAQVLMGYALNHYPQGVGTPITITSPPEKPKVQNPEKIKSEATPPSDSVADLFTVPPVAEVLEQECCLNEQRPCKHWSWDIQSGDGYVNTLSGRKLEVE